jgi:predicted nucleotidyltransferase
MPRAITSADLGIEGAGAALAALDAACRGIRAPFFLVGALAREVLLHHLRGVERSPRLTQDLDIAVAVEHWAQFEGLTSTLVDRHGFERTRTVHRLRTPNGPLVDILPFDGVEDAAGSISWPPGFDSEMSVLGYRQVLGLTELIEIDGTIIHTIALGALGPLKLLAWGERHVQTTRDAEDLCFVLSTYFDAEAERMVDRHAELFESEGGDPLFIGSRAYGRDAAQFVQRCEPLRQRVVRLLERETIDIDESRLAVAMGLRCIYAIERRFAALRRFHEGLLEGFQ